MKAQADYQENLYDTDPHIRKQGYKHFWILLIGCLGIVYGDIGTSPLYAFRETARQIATDGLANIEIYGALSLIIWSIIIIVTLKYVFFLMRVDNKGEGGILALMTLLKKTPSLANRSEMVMFIGMAGAALFYADAAITPAISVISAVEGLKEITPIFDNYTLGISIIILCSLFFFQKHGTHKVSAFFGPIMILWFLVIAIIGILWIIKTPSVLLCLSPHYFILFLVDHGWVSFAVMGTVFLAVTGAEALYADMGHFGLKPIQRAWVFFVFPCLILNYMGQGAFLSENPLDIENPFFRMVPAILLPSMVILATLATIIASQAVITGAYSLTRQAIQLGLLPLMEIKYTSEHHFGQIFMPKVNSVLLYAVLFFCILFQNSTNIAAAYGIAVSGTMIITTVLSFFFITHIWKKPLWFSCIVILPLLCIEGTFFVANIMRVLHGGFVPLLFGAYLFLLMAVWVYGSRYLDKKKKRHSIRLTDFSEKLDQDTPHITKGTAIFFTSDPLMTPEGLIKNIKYNHVIHESNIIVTVSPCVLPFVENRLRLHIEPISSKLTRIIIHFGFMETPDVPRALSLAKYQGFDLDLAHATFFLAHRKIIPSPHHGLPTWQDKIYITLSRFGIAECEFFKLPRTRVVELGVQMII